MKTEKSLFAFDMLPEDLQGLILVSEDNIELIARIYLLGYERGWQEGYDEKNV